MQGNISRRDAQQAIQYFAESAEENDLSVFFIMTHGAFFNNQLHGEYN